MMWQISILVLVFVSASVPSAQADDSVSPLYEGLTPVGPTIERLPDRWTQRNGFNTKLRNEILRDIDFASYQKDRWVLEKLPRRFRYLTRTTASQRVKFVLEFDSFIAERVAHQFGFDGLQDSFDFGSSSSKYPPIAEQEDFALKWFKTNLLLSAPSGQNELIDENFVREALLDASESRMRLRELENPRTSYGSTKDNLHKGRNEHENQQKELLRLLGYKFDSIGSPIAESLQRPATDTFFSGTRNVLILVDCSGSMSKELDTTKELLSRLVTKMPPELNCGIRIFGNGTSDPMLCCKATDLLRPLSPNPREILKFVPNLQASGQTSNVAYVLREALGKDLLGVTGKSVIILLSDGEDTCGESPPAQLSVLKYKNLTVPIVGVSTRFRWTKFSIVGNPLAKIAEITNGRYHDRDSYDIFVRDFESIRTK